MVVIGLQFIAGRFHANPWSRNVNEGVPEWPPSPYRLLRALYDAWKRKRPEWPDSRVEPILRNLASRPPMFRLPPARAAHTRGFLNQNEKEPAKKSLIFDAFVVLNPEAPVLTGWPDATLEDQQQTDLADLLALVNYMGRSESWVKAAIVPGVDDQDWNCRPSVANARSADTLESILVACTLPPDEYDAHPWKKTTRGEKASTTLLPWLEALGWSTAQLFASRRTEPPGFRYVSYLRPLKCFDPSPRRTVAVRPREVNGILYALESKLRPRITATLEIAEQVRRRLMGIHRNLMGGDPRKVSSKFSGKDASGRPLRGHRHAFILPQDADRDGWLDHLLVICRDNLDLDECRTLDLLDRLYQRGGRPDVRCIPIRWGALGDLLKPAGRFISATPFVPPRHYRRGRGDFAEWLLAQVRREASNRSLPEISRIAPVPRLCNEGKVVAWLDFRRNRKDDTVKPGYGFEIEFAQPVLPECGPMALGYGAHFGLGQFRTA